ncbi:putative pentatricopeptide repeat-containing protein [Ananas comosus]|uniref:Putative pentatricopeptide repeat-containing protein n=1 Tax=Ananas comosus TaxID=4615 RepID=A0A199UIK4_ANACO|nr:putative pentatricopeptide repeat-containing protein [Ananas comosus]
MRSLRNVIPRYNPAALIDSTTTLPQIHQIHAHLLVAGFLGDPFHYAKLVADLALSSSSSSSSSNLAYAHLLLRRSPHPPSLFALNSLIRAHSKGPDPLLAFPLYRRLLRSLPPDNFTFTFLVRASATAAAAAAASGPAVHAAALRRGLAADAHVQSGLIHMYAELGLPAASRAVYDEVERPDLVSQTAMVGALAQCGEVGSAREMFDEMPRRDPVAWNAMIAGYAHVGRSREALELFSAMQSEVVRVGEATMVSVLTACAHLGALDQGKWAHAYVQKHKLRITVTLGTALIDMYSKCGNIERAMEVFRSMRERNVYTWSSAIGGLAMNGASEECLELFDLMQREGVQPNAITFLSVLRACCVAGLVDEGRAYFASMRARHGVEPWQEHYGCVVDLYGRAGRLGEALAFINAMPTAPHAGAWGALLHACRLHGDVALGEHATRRILESESANDAAHVLLSNTYAASRDWAGVSRVRESMRAKGVRKEPGCSAIEVGGEIHEFFVGDKTHRRYREMEVMLGEMATKLREAGHVARTEGVLFDIEEEEKEGALSWHSEKLAIAFGLIASDKDSQEPEGVLGLPRG